MVGLKLGPEAQEKFDEAKKDPEAKGYLEKKGAKRKNWNNRFFVLKDNYLFYCKSEKSQPQGIINLHGCTISRISGPTIARPYCFSLLAPKSVSIDAKWTGRTYFMAAKDEKEMDTWMKRLEENGRKAAEKAAEKKEAQRKAAEEKVQMDKQVKKDPKGEESDSADEERVAVENFDLGDSSGDDSPRKDEPETKKMEETKKRWKIQRKRILILILMKTS